MEPFRWNDLRDWIAFMVGVGVPLIAGVIVVSADIAKAPESVRITVYVLTAAVLTASAFAVSIWLHQRALRRRLGLTDIKIREQTLPIHTLYQSLQRSYRWHGISAVNELVGNTEVIAALGQKIRHKVNFFYTLSDERDWLRMKEQVLWEHEPTREVSDVQKNIRNSKEVLKKFEKSAHVTLLSAARTPCFRVVEVDDHRLEVAHYDRGGCGFSGAYLVIERKSHSPKDNILYEWFQRAGEVDRKNAIIDHLYDRITAMFLASKSDDEIARKVTTGEEFEHCRRIFTDQFGWQLAEDDVNEVIKYLHKRFQF